MMSTTFDKGYALLIGIGADLPVTVQDATALRDVLVDPSRAAYPSEQVKLLTEEGADRQGILDGFDQLINKANKTSDATVIVYFSGHGGRIEQPGKSSEYFLIPYNYDLNRRSDTAVSGFEFATKIKAIKARKLVVLLDCCHAGGITAIKGPNERFVKSPIIRHLWDVLDTGSGRVVIASSHENEFSFVGEQYSVFTACLLEALTGKAAVDEEDGYVRILNVIIYLFKYVPQRTTRLQHPLVKKILELGDNFPLCYYAVGNKHVSGEAPSTETISMPTGLTARQRRRLEQRRDALQQEWDLRSKKVERLRTALAVETDIAIKFKLEQQILDEEVALARLTSELDEIERVIE